MAQRGTTFSRDVLSGCAVRIFAAAIYSSVACAAAVSSRRPAAMSDGSCEHRTLLAWMTCACQVCWVRRRREHTTHTRQPCNHSRWFSFTRNLPKPESVYELLYTNRSTNRAPCASLHSLTNHLRARRRRTPSFQRALHVDERPSWHRQRPLLTRPLMVHGCCL